MKKEKIKILLINPKVPNTFWSLKSALEFISKKTLHPPLGLLTVAAMLPDKFEKKLVDMNVSALIDDDIAWADYVFISAMIIQKNSVEQVIERVRAQNVKIVAGGPLFTAAPELFLDTVDHLVLKEAEITLPDFLNDLENGDPKPYYNTHKKAELQFTPIPQWDLVDKDKYALMCIQYSRGCPFDCDFCDITAVLGHKVRTKSAKQIIDELESLYVYNWRGEVFFVDDNFIGKRKELKNELLPAIIEWMQKRNYPFVFNTQASIDLVDDEEIMTMMVKAGFDCVFIGIESPSDLSLSECGKTQNLDRDIVAAIKKIQQFGLQVQAGFILGFDSDKPSVFDLTIKLIQDSGIVTAMVGLLNAPRGTKLYKKMKREDRLTTPPTGDNMDCTMNFIPKMDIPELLKGYRKIMETIYSQKYHSKRIKTFIKNYNFSYAPPVKMRYGNIKAFFLSMWRIGIVEKGRGHYWILLLWSLKNRRGFSLAVRYSIYGYHFRKLLKSLQPDVSPPQLY